MPLLTGPDVEQYTGGRLLNDADTERLIGRGYAVARRFCGWPVTPVQSATVKRDGDGGRLLRLPTLRLVTFTAVLEDGVDVTADVVESADASGCLFKRSGGRWSRGIANIEVTMTHGFDDVPDFDAAVLSWIDRASLAPTGGRARVIGPIQYEVEPLAAGSPFTAAERALLEPYRLESSP